MCALAPGHIFAHSCLVVLSKQHATARKQRLKDYMEGMQALPIKFGRREKLHGGGSQTKPVDDKIMREK